MSVSKEQTPTSNPNVLFDPDNPDHANCIVHLQRIIRTHNPHDPCQAIVLETAEQILNGERSASIVGILYLTNGARGYNSALAGHKNPSTIDTKS